MREYYLLFRLVVTVFCCTESSGAFLKVPSGGNMYSVGQSMKTDGLWDLDLVMQIYFQHPEYFKDQLSSKCQRVTWQISTIPSWLEIDHLVYLTLASSFWRKHRVTVFPHDMDGFRGLLTWSLKKVGWISDLVVGLLKCASQTAGMENTW